MQKFFVAGMPRTGSTLLATTLGQHPQIKMHGELFHPIAAERDGTHAMVKNGKNRSFQPSEEDAIDFLCDEVWNSEASQFEAVGFKLFGDYIKGATTDRLFLRLFESFPDLKLITIWRENLFDCLISRQIARSSGKWVENNGAKSEEAKPVPINIPVKMTQRFFESYEAVQRFLLGDFADKAPAYHVTYDVLKDDFSRCMSGIFDFLGVDDAEVVKATKKQRTFKQRAYVENWDELAQAFEGTKYQQYFVD